MTNSEAVSLLMNCQYYKQGYKQGVYDILNKIRAEIQAIETCGDCWELAIKEECLSIIDKYKAESGDKE